MLGINESGWRSYKRTRGTLNCAYAQSEAVPVF